MVYWCCFEHTHVMKLYSITPYLQVNHVLGVRGLHIAGRAWLNASLLQLVEQEP